VLDLFRSSLLVLALLPLGCLANSSQDKSHKTQQPRVVLDLQKPSAGEKSFRRRFGMTCPSQEPEASLYRDLEHPASISELLGAPIEVVRIRSYGAHWKKFDDVRKRVIQVLETQTGTIYPGEVWDEMVLADIVATIRFSDGSEGALEESGGHVCFKNHSKSTAWARISQN
jgi:hypothetical protein